MKKFLHALLALLIIATFLPTGSFAQIRSTETMYTGDVIYPQFDLEDAYDSPEWTPDNIDWVSSDTKVVKIFYSQYGMEYAKAMGPGTATLTCATGASCTITVLSASPRIKDVYYESVRDQAFGTDNRINGTLVSPWALRDVRVYVFNAQNKVVRSYTKLLPAKSLSYRLAKLSPAIKFNTLAKGNYTIKIVARTTDMKSYTVFQKKFTVKNRVPKSNYGTEIASWAMMREGDPYSQSRRGQEDYTDCSYLARWSVMQATRIKIAATAADQYKEIVSKKKTLTLADAQPGDLVFWGGSRNGRFKGIDHVDVVVGAGNDMYTGEKFIEIIGAGSNGVTYRGRMYASWGYKNVYFGRPY